jgi:GNAT superfamily N-acetyltransferase
MRYRLPEGYAHPMTDVIGELLSLDPPTVRAAGGEVVSVLPDQVVALKALAPRPVRTSEIRALEAAAADAWCGVEVDWVDGWLLRAGDGFTRRANSAVPLGTPGSFRADVSVGFATTAAATVERIRQWYAARGLAPLLVLPDRIVPVPPGWETFGETLVMGVDLAAVVLPEGPSIVTIEPTPGLGWFDMFRRHDPRALHHPSALRVVTAARGALLGFASLGVENPSSPGSHAVPLAIARGAVTDAPDGRRWVGLSSVEVAPAHRRHGLGTLICAEVLRWGRTHHATHAYVQVQADNAAAIAMYRELGFVDHHRYRYTSPPH